MSTLLSSRCFLTVEAEDDPTVAGRILHLLTVRGETPEWFSVRRHAQGALRIAVELARLDDAAAQQLSQKIRRLPTVVDVEQTWLRQRDAVKP